MASIIYYGAGANAYHRFNHLVAKSGDPVCFVDADTHKHYTSFKIMEKEYDILPLDIAIEKYPDYELWLTQIPESLLNITEYLIGKGIKKEKIHYLEEVEYRMGCNDMGRLLVVHTRMLRSCFYHYGKRIVFDEKPLTEQSLRGYVKEFMSWHKDTFKKLSMGESTIHDGCPNLKMGLYSKTPRIHWINAGE